MTQAMFLETYFYYVFQINNKNTVLMKLKPKHSVVTIQYVSYSKNRYFVVCRTSACKQHTKTAFGKRSRLKNINHLSSEQSTCEVKKCVGNEKTAICQVWFALPSQLFSLFSIIRLPFLPEPKEICFFGVQWKRAVAKYYNCLTDSEFRK